MTLLARFDETWAQQFEELAEEIRQLIGESVLAVHHVGSTAVDTVVWSKPVIDLLVEVGDFSDLDGPAKERLAESGFEGRNEYGIAGRRYFVRPASSNSLKAHVHCYEHGDPRVDRHLRFRDYLRRHREHAMAYSNLKRDLASAHGRDKAAYQAGKGEFIARVERMIREEGP